MLRQLCATLAITASLLKAALTVCIAVVLVGNAAPPVFADEPIGNLPSIQIFKKVKENYASMVTYSDEGTVVTTMNSNRVIHFTTRLARTNFYLIEWTRAGESFYSGTSGRGQAVWSSGAGDFLQAQAGVQSEGNRKIAWLNTAACSGGAAATVPPMFFNQQWEDQPIENLVFRMNRLADENVENINCYVFTSGAMGATNTLWIGKQDFLIHQAQTVANIESMPAFTFTETHTNIVLNQKFSRADFIPTFPLFQSAANDSTKTITHEEESN